MDNRRLIDANALTDIFAFLRKMWSGTEIMAVIDEATTVDAVEVVRCKDCNHSVVQDRFGLEHRCCKLEGLQQWVEDNHFCSYGERKKVDLEEVVDLDTLTAANNAAMRNVIGFMAGERKDNG